METADPNNNLEERVRKRAHKAFELLAEREGIRLNEEDYPSVSVSEEENSAYNPKENIIYIRPRDVGKGHIYAEEVAHKLRDIIQREKGVEPSDQERDVHEFFGWLGRTLVRDESQGTYLEDSFSQEPEEWAQEDYSEAEEKLKKAIERSKKTRKERRKEMEEKGALSEEFKDRLSLVETMELSAEMELLSHQFHDMGYSFAEQYSAEEIPEGIFSMSDDEIRMRYFNEKDSIPDKTKKALARIWYGPDGMDRRPKKRYD